MAEITLENLNPDVILFLLDYYGMKMEVLDGDPENPYANAKIIQVTRGGCRVTQEVVMNGLPYPENLEAIMTAAALDAIRRVIEAPLKLKLDEMETKWAECHAELLRTAEDLSDYKFMVHNGPICGICARNMKGE